MAGCYEDNYLHSVKPPIFNEHSTYFGENIWGRAQSEGQDNETIVGSNSLFRSMKIRDIPNVLKKYQYDDTRF